MSQQARKNLAPEGTEDSKKNDSKRKMTQAIIDEEENAKKGGKKEAYEFLEDDDDFEEFDIPHADDEDVNMAGAIDSAAEKKMWQEDWDDEEVDEDFAKQLRAQIRK